MANVWIPATMQHLTGGEAVVQASGQTVRELLARLEQRYPGLQSAIVQDDGRLRPGVAVAVDGYVTSLGLYQRLTDGSDVQFVPAIGGG
ncbi:MoaD/ThiS family protein [Immundisolibacter sp.]|uniref:MoaD/ThiS family protein n=2 Tax=Immundisolibacter sp. TaxID=1934948 RepID=UPI003568B293